MDATSCSSPCSSSSYPSTASTSLPPTPLSDHRKEVLSLNCKHLAIPLLFAISLIFPSSTFAEDLPVTSPFGWRIHPISGEWKFHSGVDLGYDYGATVPSLFDGQIVQSGDFGDGYGNQVLIYHDSLDCYTRYGHLSYIYVSAGEYVYAGQVIGCVGSTGYSTGPHLHLEYIIRSEDGGYQYADPLSLWGY